MQTCLSRVSTFLLYTYIITSSLPLGNDFFFGWVGEGRRRCGNHRWGNRVVLRKLCHLDHWFLLSKQGQIGAYFFQWYLRPASTRYFFLLGNLLLFWIPLPFQWGGLWRQYLFCFHVEIQLRQLCLLLLLFLPILLKQLLLLLVFELLLPPLLLVLGFTFTHFFCDCSFVAEHPPG